MTDFKSLKSNSSAEDCYLPKRVSAETRDPLDELFFSTQLLQESLANYTVEEQNDKLLSFTFSNFIRTARVQSFLKGGLRKMPTMRYVYLFFLFRRIGPYIGDMRVLELFQEHFPLPESEEDTLPSIKDVYEVCDKCGMRKHTEICLIIEAITRGQHDNILWDLFRDSIISSSKLFKTVKAGPNQNLFSPAPITNDYYVAGPLAFGLRCEELVKKLICNLILHQPTPQDCGFLQSPRDGIFGVSLDLCTNVKLVDGLLSFGPDPLVYEIKCRFKYLFSKSDYDPLFTKYRDLYDNPCKSTFIRFVFGISKPAVEFLPEGRLPSEKDYLLTFDDEWNLKPQRKRKMTSEHKILYECIKHNAFGTSTVYLFTDPSITGGKICIKSKFSVDLFINPHHSYYQQILLQRKVILDYVDSSPAACGKLGQVKNFIVSAFFRKRDSRDPLKCWIPDYTSENSEYIERHLEIPVAVVITSVAVPSAAIFDSVDRAATFWTTCAREEFDYWPWVPSSLFAGGSITP